MLTRMGNGSAYTLFLTFSVLILFTACRQEIDVDFQPVRESPEIHSFLSSNTNLSVFPVLTREMADIAGECGATGEIERLITEEFARVTVIPFYDLCMGVAGRAENGKIVTVANRFYVENKFLADEMEAIALLYKKRNITHFLLIKVDKAMAWRDLKGALTHEILLRGVLYDLSTKRVIYEFLSSGKSRDSKKAAALKLSDVATVTLKKSFEKFPYKGTARMNKDGRPDF